MSTNLVPVATMHVQCPECPAVVPIELTAEIVGGAVSIDPDMTDVWAHAFTHGDPA